MNSLDRKITTKYLILRFDGDGFSSFTKNNFEKPFDIRFHEFMEAGVRALLEHSFPEFGVFGSDEISLVYKKSRFPFGGRIEKCLSEMPSKVASTFTHLSGFPVVFDAKLFETSSEEDVFDYMKERSDSLMRNAISDAFYWNFVNKGIGEKTVHRNMNGIKTKEKLEKLSGAGFSLPTWVRTFIWAENFVFDAVNKKTGETVFAKRRKWVFSHEFPKEKILNLGKDESE